MNTLRNFTKWEAELLSGTWKKIHENYVCTLIVLGTFCICFLMLIAKDIKHHAELVEYGKHQVLMHDAWEKDQVVLSNLTKCLDDQGEVIDFQGNVIIKQNESLEKSSLTVENQAGLINQLINYLKSIGHWPPKAPPVDRSRLAI